MDLIYYSHKFSTPLGDVRTIASNRGVCFLWFITGKVNIERVVRLHIRGECIEEENDHIIQVKEELAEYFAGRCSKFSIAIHVMGSEFQKKVWMELRKVVVGSTISYEKLAERIGNIKAVRAVANAVAQNYISIVIPCHRIIGKNGSLTGYGGGLERKQWLLDHEMRKY